MQNSPLDNVIASRCVTSAGKKKKKRGFLDESHSFASCQYNFIPGLTLARMMPCRDLSRGSGLALEQPANARLCTLRAPRCEWDPFTAIRSQTTFGLGEPYTTGLQKLFPRAKHQGVMAEAEPFLLRKHLFLYLITSVGYPAGGWRNCLFWKVSPVLLYIGLDLRGLGWLVSPCYSFPWNRG